MTRNSAVFLPVAIALLLTPSVRGENMDTDLEKLAGAWACVSATSDGKPVAEETAQKLRLTITKEGGYKTEKDDQVLFNSICKVDSAKGPKHIDLIGTEGENKGKAAQGIYELDGNMLTICYTMPGKVRPKVLESKPGSATTLVVWKRAKP